jgi:EmrB/QacA subfamily drug resistance transporter
VIKRDNTQTLQQPPRPDAALKRVGGQRRRDEGTTVSSDGRTRWLALIVLYLGALMIVLDTTIVNVALPSIRASLGFSETSLAWVVNAYMLTFGGFLLLGGWLGDLFGQRRLFLMGITLASLACGLATTQVFLVSARAIQGLGGAVVSAVALSLVMNLFTEPAERAKAMGLYGFVAVGGGSIGVLLGGILTNVLNWHWIFLVNLPVGVAVFALSLVLLPGSRGRASTGRLDIAGAVTVTASLMLAVYAIVNGNDAGWTSIRTIGLLVAAAALLALFLGIEARVRSPLVPPGLFRLRNVATANVVGVLWTAAMFAWFFLSALYLQLVLGYSPLQVGLAFLPANVIMGAFSLGLSAKLVTRFGIRLPLAMGLLLAAVGLALFARAPGTIFRMTARVIPTIHVSCFTCVKRRWEPRRSMVGMTLAVILGVGWQLARHPHWMRIGCVLDDTCGHSVNSTVLRRGGPVFFSLVILICHLGNL